MTKLWKCASFDVSMKIWGYELAGDASDFSATVSENRNGCYDQMIYWDQDLPRLLSYERWVDGVLQPIKWFWAFRWLSIKLTYEELQCLN